MRIQLSGTCVLPNMADIELEICKFTFSQLDRSPIQHAAAEHARLVTATQAQRNAMLITSNPSMYF